MTRYLLSEVDRALVDCAATLLKRVAAANLGSPAQLVSIGKALHALIRMPQVSQVGDISLSVISPRRRYGDVEVYFWWDVAFEDSLVTIKSGGHFYRPSSGGDSFQSMMWQANPGEPAELRDYHANLAIVPGLRSFLTDIPTADELAGFELSVEDECNELLEEEGELDAKEAAYDPDVSANVGEAKQPAAAIAKAKEDAAQSLVLETIRWLKGQRSDLAGEDSGLGNVWLEFCAQVQGEQSVDWDQYELIVREIIEGEVVKLSDAERQALWFQTEAGKDWLDEENVDGGQVPVFLENVIDDLYSKVWQRAANWQDGRLERYLSGSSDDDYDQSDDEDEDENEDEEVDEDQDRIDSEVGADWLVAPLDEVERALAGHVDPAKVDVREPQFAYGVEDCGVCGTELSQFGLMVDGRLKGSPMWGNLCAHCFAVQGEGIGNGVGQLYARQPDGRWRLVAGFLR